jgi:hypothetical protein
MPREIFQVFLFARHRRGMVLMQAKEVLREWGRLSCCSKSKKPLASVLSAARYGSRCFGQRADEAQEFLVLRPAASATEKFGNGGQGGTATG